MPRKSHFSAKAELKGIDNLSVPWSKALKQAEKDAGRSFGRIERAARRTRRGFLRTTRTARKLGAGMKRSFGPAVQDLRAVGVAGGVAAAGMAMAVDRFGEYELSVARIGNLLPDTVDAVELLSDTINRQAVELGKAPLEVAEASYQAFSSGVEKSEAALDSFLGVAGKGAVAGNAELADSVAVLTTIMENFREEAQDVEKISDRLFLTEAEGVTTFGELAANLGQVAARAGAVKAPLNDVLALAASLTKGLGKGSTPQAMTQLSSLLAGIQDPGDRTKAFEKAGLPTGALALKQVGGLTKYVGLIKELVDSGESVGGKSGKDLITALFGRKEAQNALFRVTGEGFEDVVRVTQEMGDAGDITDRKFANIQRRTGFRIAQMKTGLSILTNELGGGLAEGFGLGAIEDIPAAVQGASQTVRASASVFASAFVEAFAPLEEGEAFDWPRFAEEAGSSLGSIASAVGTVTTKIAEMINTYVEMWDLAKDVKAWLEGDGRTKAGAKAKEQGAQFLQPKSGDEIAGLFGGSISESRFKHNVGEGLFREVSQQELAAMSFRQQAGLNGQGADVGGEIKIQVEVDGGSAKVVSIKPKSAKVPITVNTGERSVGGAGL